jgi:hypothetical protein
MLVHIYNLDTTDDYDLKILVDLINEQPIKPNGWVKVILENDISIFRKTVNNLLNKYDDNPVVMIKAIVNIPNFTREEVFEAIANVSIRKEWDKIFSEFKIIETTPEGGEILYMSIKVI